MAIREGRLPVLAKRKLREQYPQLEAKDADLVERGFRQFFMACARSDGKHVAMPSKAVDAYWHALILDTRSYAEWCERTLGRFLHHVPAERLGGDAAANDGLRRAWFFACKDEAIDPRKPSRLPLLFALDAKLGIPGGVVYSPRPRPAGSRRRVGRRRRDHLWRRLRRRVVLGRCRRDGRRRRRRRWRRWRRVQRRRRLTARAGRRRPTVRLVGFAGEAR
jgi:hypothetical protein